MHRTLRNSLCYAKLIGIDDDEDSLKQYSRLILWGFIEEQLVHLQKHFREIDSFIINYVQIFDDVIIKDSIPITDMPPLLHTEISE